jgi:hypothetical protein
MNSSDKEDTVGKEMIRKEFQTKSTDKRLSTADHLKAMGEYFEIPKDKVKFYIRQLELSKKI